MFEFLKLFIRIITAAKDVDMSIPITTRLSSSELNIKDPKVTIDWTNPKVKISKYFTVKEALYLPSWNRLANESDGLTDEIKNNLVILFNKLDKVREYFQKSINVHVTYRPEEYNKLIGGAPMSAHKIGKACDFDISGMNCDEVRNKIMDNSLLDIWNLRMEHLDGSNWIHLGNDYKNGNRYFIP